MPKARDLAGLAALGFLGYKMSQMGKNKDNAGEQKTSSYTKDTKKVAASDNQKVAASDDRMSNEDYIKSRMKKAPEDEKGSVQSDVLKAVTATKEAPNDKAPNQGVVPSKSSGKSAAAKQAPSGRREDKADTSREDKADTSRKTTASSSVEGMKNYAPRRGLSPVDQIPGQDRSGPTGGERVTGTELGRNVSNTMSALTPLGGGVGKIGAEMATSGRAQRAYNAAQAERRAAEGMSPAEAIAAKQAAVQAARDAKTLNPNAWLAGPKGMAENFRKGGAVKMTASRRGDGIASRGKTRGKLY